MGGAERYFWLGARFDVSEFHDRGLGNGLTLPMLRRQLERWAEGLQTTE